MRKKQRNQQLIEIFKKRFSIPNYNEYEHYFEFRRPEKFVISPFFIFQLQNMSKDWKKISFQHQTEKAWNNLNVKEKHIYTKFHIDQIERGIKVSSIFNIQHFLLTILIIFNQIEEWLSCRPNFRGRGLKGKENSQLEPTFVIDIPLKKRLRSNE